MPVTRLVISLTISGMIAAAQTQESQLRFEVASVKKSAPLPAGGRGALLRGMRGGPGTSDPGRVTYTAMPLAAFVRTAYGLKDYQIAGPEWMYTELYDIVAEIPEGTTKDQFRVMMQNLLAERFHLAVHREARELRVYELVLGKDGPKLQKAEAVEGAALPDSEIEATPPGGTRGRERVGSDGFPDLPPGRPGVSSSVSSGLMRMAGRMQPVSELADKLESLVGRPVVDKTGLAGSYDFKLRFSTAGLGGAFSRARAVAPEQQEDGPDILDAIQSQLGLKLESAKDEIDMLVIDHADRVPVEN